VIPYAEILRKCSRCGVSNKAEAWRENGFVCPFCDRWYHHKLHMLIRSRTLMPAKAEREEPAAERKAA